MITLDIPNRKLDVAISEEEMNRRKAAFVAPAPKPSTPYLSRYAEAVSGVWKGAVLETAAEKEKNH